MKVSVGMGWTVSTSDRLLTEMTLLSYFVS